LPAFALGPAGRCHDVTIVALPPPDRFASTLAVDFRGPQAQVESGRIVDGLNSPAIDRP
jgi:hypothetical protein